METNATPAEILAFHKARAKSLKGAWLPALFAAAFPNWKVEETTALLHINDVTRDSLQRMILAARVASRVSPLIASDYNDKALWHVEGLNLPVEVAPVVKGKVVVPDPQPGVLYSGKAPRPGTWGQTPTTLVTAPAVGLRAWVITAPNGASTTVLDKPRHPSDPLTPDAFWKWAYSNGLAEEAQALLPTTAEEEAAKRAAAVKRGLGTCGCCFGSYARHTGGTMVQHGYKMAGGGYGSGHLGMFKATGDCFGVGWQPWEVSAACTKAWSARLEAISRGQTKQADDWEHAIAHPDDVSEARYSFSFYRRNFHGSVQEKTVLGKHDRTDDWTKVEILPGRPGWEPRARAAVKAHREEAKLLHEESIRFAGFAQNWPKYPF